MTTLLILCICLLAGTFGLSREEEIALTALMKSFPCTMHRKKQLTILVVKQPPFNWGNFSNACSLPWRGLNCSEKNQNGTLLKVSLTSNRTTQTASLPTQIGLLTNLLTLWVPNISALFIY